MKLITSAKSLFLLFTGLSSGCAIINDIVESSFEKPKISFVAVKIESLSFEAIGLAFDLKIENPNPVSVSLAGYDYNLLLNDHSFVSGSQNEHLTIKADDESIVRVPVTLKYKDIYETLTDLAGADEADYQFSLGLSFELPVLGKQRLPVSKTGTFPLLKVPTLNMQSMRLSRLSVTSADLILTVEFGNPNLSAFVLKNIDYTLEVAGKQWLTGCRRQSIHLAPNHKTAVQFPFSLNFFEIGKSVFGLLTAGAPLHYRFKGQVDIGSMLPLMGDVRMPFDQSGEIEIIK
ncbi:MAG: LEA type 2 family protein [bacterium]